MEDNRNEAKNLPPYLPYKTFSNFLDGLRVAMPAKIDRSIMGSMAGGVQSQVIAALKYLGLVTASHTPTDKLARLVNSEGHEREKALRDVLTSAYPFIFKDGFDLQRATPRQLDDQFERAGASGDTVRKCVAFFISAARDANIPLSPYIAKLKRAPRNNNRIRRSNAIASSPAKVEEESQPIQTTAMNWSQLLLSKFPSFDPAWPPDVQSKWFEAFEKLMKYKAPEEVLGKGEEE